MAVKKSSGEPEELKATAWQGMELESATSPTAPRAADSYFEEVFTRLYGKMSFEEKLRLIWLSSTLFFIIGGYWLLRSLKDPVIATICGVEYIPKAKMLSVLVVTVLVFVYNKLIDMFPKHQLFYIVGGFYATLFTIIAVALALPATSSLSIYNTEPSPYRLLGWVSYCSIESFGSIGVSLFWAFTNSTYNLEGAKKAYGLMVACAQLGSIAGPTIVTAGTIRYGVPTIYFCGALCMVFMVVSIWAAQESEIPNFKGSFLGRLPLVSADFWTSDHLSERSRSVDVFLVTRARGTLTLKRRCITLVLPRPVVVATQMLESMIDAPTPTRAECSDIATAIYDGADAVMLSAESAAGLYPEEAVTMQRRVISRVEADELYRARNDAEVTAPEKTATDAITAAARSVALTIGAKCMVVFTSLGTTVRRAAKGRPPVPILALTPSEDTARALALTWGVYSRVDDYFGEDVEFNDVLKKAVGTAKDVGFLDDDLDVAVVTAGLPWGTPGASNVLRVVPAAGPDNWPDVLCYPETEECTDAL